jgi:hypothetical protein
MPSVVVRPTVPVADPMAVQSLRILKESEWAPLAMDHSEDIDIAGERRRIAIITGANGYIPLIAEIELLNSVLGVKIAQRLLEGVCPNAAPSTQKFSEEHERIRVILACRSKQKAEAAAETLRGCFPNRTLLLDIEDLDLCCMQNIEDFCKRLLNR